MSIRYWAAALAIAIAVPATALADTLDKVSESGIFTIGFREDAAPFSVLREDGQPAGYSIDLCIEIAKGVGNELGLAEMEVVFSPVTAQNRFAALAEGEIDILCGATTATLTRRQTMDFSVLTFVSGASVMVRGDSPIESLIDTAGGKVGVLGSTTTEGELRATLSAERIDAEVVTFATRPEGLSALLSGEIDAFFGDRELLLGLAMGLSDPRQVRLSNRYLSIEPYALAMRLGDNKLRLVADRTIARIYRGGGINQIFQRWFRGGDPSDLLAAMIALQGLPE